MKVFVGNQWRDGFLDYHRPDCDYRIAVRECANLEALGDLYLRPKRSLRLIWNYLREIGFRSVLRKIISRWQETFRNEKWLSVGFGEVLESPPNGEFQVGETVLFLATSHPACAERFVVPGEMLAHVGDVERPFHRNRIRFRSANGDATPDKEFRVLRGWVSESGRSLPDNMTEHFQRAATILHQADWSSAQELPTGDTAVATDTIPKKPIVKTDKKRAVLFGYGQYAKTMCLPNIKHHLEIARIHEIDPLQIPRKSSRVGWSTRAEPNADDDYDVCFIAGYHHTHAPIAVEALRRGATAVVEKPVAVNASQLHALVAAMRQSDGQLFACYQKRYSKLNDWARQDLQLGDGDPVSYHCVVFEIPLPHGHWYLWPNSGSRLVSNGCHWLDHFLYLNNFCEVQDCSVVIASDGTLNVSVELTNRAFFTMTLTDNGSRRIGVQDYIELRANGRTVRMVGGFQYSSESEDCILRKGKVHKFQSYGRMYQEIARKIAAGETGDSVRSLEVTARLVQTLEEYCKPTTASPRLGRAA